MKRWYRVYEPTIVLNNEGMCLFGVVVQLFGQYVTGVRTIVFIWGSGSIVWTVRNGCKNYCVYLG